MASVVVLGAVVGAVLAVFWLLVRKRGRHLPYPPGPKGLPIIGNLLDMNLKEPQLAYTEWGKIYGDIVYSHIFGQDFIIVNSEDTARLLADKRSRIYSDRPPSPVYRLFGIGRMTPLMKYGDDWRIHRKLFHLSLGPHVVEKYHDLYINNAHKLLRDLQQDGSNYAEHIKLFSSALGLELTYGRKAESKKDSTIQLVSEVFDIIGPGTTAECGGLLLAFPILEHFPSWFPGLGFTREAPRCRRMIANLSDVPFDEAKEQLESGVLQRCLVSDFLTHGGVDESAAKDAATGVYLAAVESTSSTLETLILLMLLHPDVQEKIHAEFDTIIGRGILPTFKDRPRLPYMQAALYESMRWHPVFPLGVPHSTTTSDIYNGYYIPKGSIVIFNVWAMSRNCPDPERFDPGRHLTPDGQLTLEAQQNNILFFGFGRRVCPGRFFADNALWAAAAIMLSALRFEKARDDSGNLIQVEPAFTHGQVSHPMPFSCSVMSRV
ncbi:hypothetical protein ID866_7904 [Astraeus odoratus]|nr:hypothetical protein ID866_7904 [Astraeus odoratus]